MATCVRALFTSDVFARKIHVSEAVANLPMETDQPDSCAPRTP